MKCSRKKKLNLTNNELSEPPSPSAEVRNYELSDLMRERNERVRQRAWPLLREREGENRKIDERGSGAGAAA